MEKKMSRPLKSDESLDSNIDLVEDHWSKKEEEDLYTVVQVEELEGFLNNNPEWKLKQSVDSDKFLVERT
jgi:hypothetical protein